MDVSQYLEIFIDETKEHLQNLNDLLLVLEKEPEVRQQLTRYSVQHILLREWQEPWDTRECRISHIIWRMFSLRSATIR